MLIFSAVTEDSLSSVQRLIDLVDCLWRRCYTLDWRVELSFFLFGCIR